MPPDQWSLPVISDWAKHPRCTPRHAWRPCACGRTHTSCTTHTVFSSSPASSKGSVKNPLAVIRTWALRVLLLAALCITARALYADAVCLYSHRGGGVTTSAPIPVISTVPPPAVLHRTHPDLGVGRYARLVGVQAEALEGVLAAGVSLRALAREIGVVRAGDSRVQVQDAEGEDNSPALAEAAEAAAGTLDALRAEIGVVVDRAIKTHALTHFALQRTSRRSPRHAAPVVRRAQRVLLTELEHGTKRLSGLADVALKALDALDARVAELRGSPSADSLMEVWLRALDTQRADARRVVQAVARVLREVDAALQGVDTDNDGTV